MSVDGSGSTWSTVTRLKNRACVSSTQLTCGADPVCSTARRTSNFVLETWGIVGDVENQVPPPRLDLDRNWAGPERTTDPSTSSC